MTMFAILRELKDCEHHDGKGDMFVKVLQAVFDKCRMFNLSISMAIYIYTHGFEDYNDQADPV